MQVHKFTKKHKGQGKDKQRGEGQMEILRQI